jgi:sugar phosphate isomerase/epimerase
MSTGSAASPIPLLKAAPEPDQVAERLEGGPWAGMELALLRHHVADDAAIDRAVRTVRDALDGTGMVVAAEAPVSWASGAHVRVDRLDAEAREQIERSAAFAAGIGSPVLTIHLYIPQTPQEFRAGVPVDDRRSSASSPTSRRCAPSTAQAAHRERPAGPAHAHRRRVLHADRRALGRPPALARAVAELGFTLDTSHAALFRSFAAAYPTLFGLRATRGSSSSATSRSSARRRGRARLQRAGILGEGLLYDDPAGELDLDPVVARIGQLVPYVVAEINEPDHRFSPNIKDGYRHVERALARRPSLAPAAAAPAAEDLDWQAVLGRRDPSRRARAQRPRRRLARARHRRRRARSAAR